MSSSISRADVLALMPYPILTKVVGEPTYQAMKQWKKEMSSNLISVSMPADWGRGKGLLGELQDAAIFLARNGAAYNPPAAAPPAYPVIPNGATTSQREELRATNATANMYWNKAVHAKRLAVNIGAQALEQFVYAELDDPDEGLNGVEIMILYNHVMDRFASISQLEIDSNMTEFMEQMDPTTTLAVYNRRQERCQEIAQDARVPISEATMVTTGTKHAVATGGMEETWKLWKRIPTLQQTWNRWKSHWTAAFHEKRELTKLTGTASFGMANQAREDALGNQMVSALDNLANAAVQRNDTFEQLVKTNASQQEEIKKLTTIITNLSLSKPGNNHQTTTTTGSRFQKEGYCWWHGYKVAKGHSSLTCKTGKNGDAAEYEQHKNSKRGHGDTNGCQHNKGWDN